MKNRFVFTGVLALAMLSVVCGCREKPKAASQSLFPDDLKGDANRTYVAYVRATKAGTARAGSEIPPAYWADRIKALHPIKVYIHRANIVVVQGTSGGREEGKYIHIPFSSYLPQTGDDGFVFSPNPSGGKTYTLGNGVFDFKRTTSK